MLATLAGHVPAKAITQPQLSSLCSLQLPASRAAPAGIGCKPSTVARRGAQSSHPRPGSPRHPGFPPLGWAQTHGWHRTNSQTSSPHNAMGSGLPPHVPVPPPAACVTSSPGAAPGQWCQGVSEASCVPECTEPPCACATAAASLACARRRPPPWCCLHRQAGECQVPGQEMLQRPKKNLSSICLQLQLPQMPASTQGGKPSAPHCGTAAEPCARAQKAGRGGCCVMP